MSLPNVHECDNSYGFFTRMEGPLWSWSYGGWVYNYLCNQCLSPLTLWVWIPFRRGLFSTTLCDKIVSDLLGTPVSSTNKTDRRDTTKILLKVVLNTSITQEWSETSTFHTTSFVTNECIGLFLLYARTYNCLWRDNCANADHVFYSVAPYGRSESATIPSYTIDKEVQVRKCTHYVQALVLM